MQQSKEKDFFTSKDAISKVRYPRNKSKKEKTCIDE
jgi:hypothetical protein